MSVSCDDEGLMGVCYVYNEFILCLTNKAGIICQMVMCYDLVNSSYPTWLTNCIMPGYTISDILRRAVCAWQPNLNVHSWLKKGITLSRPTMVRTMIRILIKTQALLNICDILFASSIMPLVILIFVVTEERENWLSLTKSYDHAIPLSTFLTHLKINYV